MKAQKLGLVLGMNMAVACLVMQGCKAVKPVKDLPPPEPVTVETPAAPVATVTEAPVVTEVDTPAKQEVAPPPATRTVAKLPPPPAPKKPAAPVAPSVGAAPSAATVHTVKRGEILSSISKKYNVKMSAIVAANPGINPDRIRIGQKLNIPGSAAAPKSNVMLASTAAKECPGTAANTAAPVKVKPAFKAYKGPTKEYVVKGGDSLGKIALASGISIRALKEMNGLTKDNVRAGQKLLVPAEKQSAQKPAVEKKAPEVKKEAEKQASAPEAKAPVEAPVEKKDAAAENKDAPAEAAVEQKPAEPVTEKPVEPAAPAEPAGNTYVVKEGDDIVSISIAWGISPSQLMNANDLKENEPLKPGQTLKLPPNARQTAQ